MKKQWSGKIDPHRLVKVTCMGDVTELMAMKFNHKQNIQKLNDKEYLNLSTGEIFDFELSYNRADNKNSLRQSMRKLRNLINTNCSEPKKVKWITLTYAENMQDTKKLYNDFKVFNILLRRKIGHYEYIVVPEPQARGAWHLHLLMIFDHIAPYIPNETFSSCWKHGFFNLQSLKNIDNVGAYLTAYLADIPIEENPNYNGDKIKTVEGKKYIKGGRLSMYPVGFNLYRTSRGIKRPTSYFIQYNQLDFKRLGKLTFSSYVLMYDEEKIMAQADYNQCVPNMIYYEYYNRRRF